MSIRPVQDWLLVKFDPLKKRSSLIELAGSQDTSAVRTGTVLRVGRGKLTKKGVRVPIGVEPGERIAFLRWHQEHRPGKAVSQALADLGDDVFMIRQNDILFSFDGDLTVDV